MPTSSAAKYQVSTARLSASAGMTVFEQLRMATDVLRQEARAIQELADDLPVDFCLAVEQVLDCQGAVIVSGVGKAGWIGQKISASLASTGTPSHFLHPSEALHGDLGRVTAQDLVLVLSNSGETAEVLSLLGPLANIGARVMALTGNEGSTLAQKASVRYVISQNPKPARWGWLPQPALPRCWLWATR